MRMIHRGGAALIEARLNQTMKNTEKDKEARNLIEQLERSRGAKVSKPQDRSYDLLIRESSGDIHAEIKGMDMQSTWVGINGIRALQRLIDDPAYRLYFCAFGNVPAVLRCRSAWLYSVLQWDLPELDKLQKAITYLSDPALKSKVKLLCRVTFHLPIALGLLIKAFESLDPKKCQNTVDGIWRFDAGIWKQTFHPPVTQAASGGHS